MRITKESIVGQVVAENFKAASIFKLNGIDFCCKGNRSIEKVCSEKGLDVEQMLKDLQNSNLAENSDTIDFRSWDLDLLTDYIEKKHHRYVEKSIPELMAYLARIAQVHGDKHPELLEVEQLFNESAAELTQHMKKEELVLFPYIRKMQNGTKDLNPHFGSVQNPIKMMMMEHETEGGRFEKISALTQGYNPPADACNTYKVAFSLLKEFEEDLHKHIHLENNILFPRAIEMESMAAAQ